MAVTVNGLTGLTFNNGSTQDVGGVGTGSQTWQDVTASRALSTTYTNTTGKPIMVAFVTTSGVSVDARVNGVRLTEGGANGFAYGQSFFIVPNGATYSIAAGNLQRWCELR